MKTIRAKMVSMLFERGMFEKDAEEIIDAYLASEAGKPMAGRMKETADAYPAAVLASTWMGINHAAIEWIDAKYPAHWARPLFADAA